MWYIVIRKWLYLSIYFILCLACTYVSYIKLKMSFMFKLILSLNIILPFAVQKFVFLFLFLFLCGTSTTTLHLPSTTQAALSARYVAPCGEWLVRHLVIIEIVKEKTGLWAVLTRAESNIWSLCKWYKQHISHTFSVWLYPWMLQVLWTQRNKRSWLLEECHIQYSHQCSVNRQ